MPLNDWVATYSVGEMNPEQAAVLSEIEQLIDELRPAIDQSRSRVVDRDHGWSDSEAVVVQLFPFRGDPEDTDGLEIVITPNHSFVSWFKSLQEYWSRDWQLETISDARLALQFRWESIDRFHTKGSDGYRLYAVDSLGDRLLEKDWHQLCLFRRWRPVLEEKDSTFSFMSESTTSAKEQGRALGFRVAMQKSELSPILKRWDPLGVYCHDFDDGPEDDEYDDLHYPVLKVLKDGGSANDVSHLLARRLASDYEIGEGKPHPKIAAEIYNWYRKRFFEQWQPLDGTIPGSPPSRG